MERDDGKLYYGIGLDNSQLQQDAAEASQILHGIDEEAERQSAAVRELFTNIPTINIDIVSNAAKTFEDIEMAFAETDRVIGENQTAIRLLEKEYDRLSKAAAAAFNKGDDKSERALRKQAMAVREVIRVRKQVVKEAGALSDELVKEEQRLKEEAVTVEKAAQKHVSLRTRLREVKEQLTEMEAAGQRGTTAYREMQEEAAKLSRSWAGAQKQVKALAHAQRGIQGFVSGLQGLTAAASVAQGAVGLFGGENDKLQQIMLRVQSVMSISIGLQQVQQTLNKNSAFSLVTLNGLKEWWNKLLVIGRGEQIAETAAKTADTTATVANTASKGANALATGQSAAAEGIDTASKISNTIAAKTGTIANIGLAGAFRMVGAAIKSIPVFGWIATAIAAIVAVIGVMVKRTNEARKAAKEAFNTAIKKQEEFNKAVADKAAEQITIYNKLSREYKNLGSSLNVQKKFIKDNQDAFHGLGVQINNVNDANNYLIKKSNDVIAALMAQARAAAAFDMAREKQKKLIQLQSDPIIYKKAKKEVFIDLRTGTINKEYESDNYKKEQQAEIDKARNKRKQQIKETEEDLRKLAQIQDKANKEYTARIKNTGVKEYTGKKDSPKKEKQDKFDYGKSLARQKEAVEQWEKSVQKYIKDAEDKVSDYTVSVMKGELKKELAQIDLDTRRKEQSWKENLQRLAESRREAEKTAFMAKKGANEAGWAKSENGKKSIEDWIAVIRKESPKVAEEYDRVSKMISESGANAAKEAQQRYTDALIDEYGTAEQKQEKQLREWTNKLKYLPIEFVEEAKKQMDEAFSKLDNENFKKAINWEGVFGDLSKQSLPVLEFTLGKIKQYFEQNKGAMSTQEIKDFQEAIKNMENEIANRNPFTALHKAIKDISSAKTELINSYTAMQLAEERLKTAIEERKAAQEAYNEILTKVESGEIVDGCDEQAEAYDRLNEAKENDRKATEEANNAEQRYMRAQNQSVNAYKRTSTALLAAGNVITGIGSKAKKLASIFSVDVSNSMEKVLDFMEEMIGSTSNVINAIGNVGKNVAGGIKTAVQASAEGSTAAATAGAQAISMVEKASVILAVVSAALQVATAIANLFNNDDSKQKEIEKLQERIDQLQWELDNKEAVRLQDNYGDALKQVRQIYADTTEEIIKMHLASDQYGNSWSRWLTALRHKAEIHKKTIEKIADAYAAMDYTADKALGTRRFEEARKDLEKLSEQQLLLQEQIDKEKRKKKTDHRKVQEMEQKQSEIRAKAQSQINEMLEDIIGSSAKNLASELGNAFFEAAKKGEDAMEGWHKKVNDIVADIMKRMLIKREIEDKVGDLFNKYKQKLFPNGEGEDAVQTMMSSIDDFTRELDDIGAKFKPLYDAIEEKLKQRYDSEDINREASQKGIATASQESVDELNGRATAIQGHTYNISEYTKMLVGTTNLILQSVVNIEGETTGFGARLERMEDNLKGVKDTIDDIALKGIKIL